MALATAHWAKARINYAFQSPLPKGERQRIQTLISEAKTDTG